MDNTRVLISGASVAGPAIAFWLNRYGFETTVVERARGLRPGGFGVDFRGHVHLAVLERMGILDDVRREQTHMGEMAFVDGDGNVKASLPSFVASGDVEIERSDLSRILHERTRDSTEYIFGDSIASLDETPDEVHVTFEHREPRTFDLVIGADGLHSNVRQLVFGDESQFLRFAGWYVAGGYVVPNDLGLDHRTLSYTEPGRTISLSSGRDAGVADVSFVFASDVLDIGRHDLEGQKRVLRDRFADVGWEAPRALEALGGAPALYFDSLSRIDMDRFVRGRVALLGDAGYGATLGGLGTGLAIVGAYVLAGELASAGGDHQVGFAAYEREIRAYAAGCQKLADGAGPFLAPRTSGEIRRRNIVYRLLSLRPLARFFNGLTTKAATDITLKDYSAYAGADGRRSADAPAEVAVSDAA
jgi:2-polyprenyl-6-methoxyphenol hydroxylase-like FAD-dependent oxidoreductase